MLLDMRKETGIENASRGNESKEQAYARSNMKWMRNLVRVS